MKKKWYLKTWLICILFALWFLYGIPLLIGIVLLILKNRQEKLLFSENEKLSTEVTDLNQLLTPEMQDAHTLQNLVNSLHQEEAYVKLAIENAKI